MWKGARALQIFPTGNARLSERSQRRGQRFEALMRPAAQSVALVLAQSEADAARLSAAGGRNVVVSGNLKFDMAPIPAPPVAPMTAPSA